ncbi:MAG: ABC transporter permease [Acidimicrobiia bacterium]|nr:ABC transporter permease [Acidimicrobiia bacterium]
MLRNVFTKWLWDARRSVLVWTLAIVVVGGGYAAFWPTINTPGIQEALESYPQGLREALNYDDLSTASGYLTASVYGLIVALLLVVYAVSAGTRIIAGDEEASTLDLILAHPVSRIQLALQRFASFVLSVVIIVSVFWLGMLALIVPAQLDDISTGQFAAMHVHLVLFTSFFGAVTYATGAATGRKSFAIGIGSGVGVLGYFAQGIIPQLEGLEWVENLSPFHWLIGGDPLRNGLQVGDCLLMLGLVGAVVMWGSWAFSRRDIAV